MIESFIHEEYVNKRREQRRQQHQQQQQHQQRHRRRQTRALQIEIEKVKVPPAATTAAAGEQSPRDQQHQAAAVSRSPVGSPTADSASFRHHLFDYLKPY
ncbi:hypothetical protein BS78_04G148200 [Paspalum vaginatum]|nr:hypothetical protein BS78_04G148200 [Paspalum vaginatum]